MPEIQAQIAAPESVPQAVTACEFCARPIVLDPNLPECCHKQAAVYHTLQLDSARNVSRHIVALTKRIAALEAKFAELEAPAPVLRKAKG